MQIQWYPGHMTKAKRAMKEDIKLIDLVIELVDARVPLGSRNPDIDELAKGKGRIVLLNKADLADDGCTERWIAWFKEQGIHALRINARSGMGMKQIQPLVQEHARRKLSVTAAAVSKPPGADDGSRHSECRKIDLYQFLCRKSLRQDWK